MKKYGKKVWKLVPELETERLSLREISLEDTDYIVKWRSDRNVYQYFQAPHKLSKEEHMAWYENEYVVDEGRFEWMCFRKDTGERIGVFGIKKDKDQYGEAEVSYLLSCQSRHFGFGGEAVGRLTEWCKEIGIAGLKAKIHENNQDSIHFIERMGFCRNGQMGCFIIYVKQISILGRLEQ